VNKGKSERESLRFYEHLMLPARRIIYAIIRGSCALRNDIDSGVHTHVVELQVRGATALELASRARLTCR